MINLEPFLSSLLNFEKKFIKHLAILFPCYYLLYYLFFVSFLNLSIFTQCMIALATTIIIFSIFIAAELLYTAFKLSDEFNSIPFEELFNNSTTYAFLRNIITIFIVIILGICIGFNITTIIIISITIVVFFIVKCIHLIYKAYKKMRGK